MFMGVPMGSFLIIKNKIMDLKKISRKDVFIVASRTNGKCFYCNKPAECIDHFISKVK